MTDTDELPLPWIKTPLVESVALSKIAGCRILLKLDNLQPSGSFKSRGIGSEILFHLRADPQPSSTPHFYTSSGGNAGLACVAACVTLGYPSTVVVPQSTKAHMIEKLRLAGASDVIQHGATWFEADKHLREEVLANDPGGAYLHPFDHPAVRDGNATMVEEIKEQMGHQDMDGIVCSVGGGGLFSGIAQGLQGRSKIIAVETKGAESLYASVQAGKLVTLNGITSIATSLGATTVAPKTFEYAMKDNVQSVLVTDEEACRACVRFAEDERMLVEPACGATLALAYEGRLPALFPNLNKETTIVLVVCGGRNIGLEMIQEWKAAYM